MLKRRTVEEYFLSAGVVKYFLPEIPYWANFSQEASCRRERTIKFLDLESVQKSLDLKIEESLQLQLMFNEMVFDTLQKNHVDHIPFKDEEDIFFRASEKIQANIRTFRVPKYNTVHLYWIDPYRETPSKIRNILNSDLGSKGHPIFISLCMTRQELASWMKTNNFSNQNIRMMSYELLTPYDRQGLLGTKYSLFINDLVADKKDKRLFIPRKSQLPQVFEGTFSLNKY